MEKYFYNKKPIEVEFHNVAESDNYHYMNTNKVVKSKKSPLKMVATVFNRKVKEGLNNKSKLVERIIKALSFCKRLGNISILKKCFLDVPKLCDMLIDTLNGVYKNTPFSSLVMVAIAIVYAICPTDILCDTIPILGIMDDALILKIVLDTIKNDLQSYSSWKEIQDAV